MLPTATTLDEDKPPPNNDDNGCYIFTTTDLEEGIEVPIQIIGTSLVVVAASEDDDNNDFSTASKKDSPTNTKTVATLESAEDDDDEDFANDGTPTTSKEDAAPKKATLLSSCRTSFNKRPLLTVLLLLSIIAIVTTITAALSINYVRYTNNQAQDEVGEEGKQVQFIGNNCSPQTKFPLNECQGDCDTDEECSNDLICYQRYTSYASVPGCKGGEMDGSDTDYCVVRPSLGGDNEESSLGGGGDKQQQPPEEDEEEDTTKTTTITATNTTGPRDLFLLSGQSNMVGHTTSTYSIGGNGKYWNKIKSILEQEGGDLDIMEQKLYNNIYKTNYYNDEVATTLTNGVMDLYKSALLNDLDTPLMFGRCSFQEAISKSAINDVSQGTVPISSIANCGHAFGHELLFGRTLELSMNYTQITFELHKVARGGSSLFQHWYPNHGQHWNLLKQAIEEKRGQDGDWKGFIWHQGSQEAWSEEEYGEDRSLTYYGNLTGLVNEVRELMFQNSMTWQCKEEIPVVIVQVGYWPGSNAAAKRTRDAQARLCNEDPRAVLVKTDDLSRFYHFDAASFLISGNRIAHAYQEALGGVVECPDT